MIAFRRWKRNSYSEFFRVIEVDGLDHPVPITRRTSIEPGRGSGGFKLVAADSVSYTHLDVYKRQQ